MISDYVKKQGQEYQKLHESPPRSSVGNGITPPLERASALSYLKKHQNRRGCRGCGPSDKTGLSDVSLSSAPAHVAGKRPQCQPAALPNGGAPRI
jgi:hypothetical protein